MLTHKTGHNAGKGNVSGFLLLTAPLIGFFYVVSLPFIGIAATAVFATAIVTGKVYNLAVSSVSFGWRPATSYLSGKNKKK